MKNSSENNQKVLSEMILVFYPQDKLKKETCFDFMGYKIDKDNKLTYHHIKKASALREENLSDGPTFDNGACLGEYSHEALHYLENIDRDLYDEWNELFLKINKSKKEFDKEEYFEIFDLQQRSMKAIEDFNQGDSKREKK